MNISLAKVIPARSRRWFFAASALLAAVACLQGSTSSGTASIQGSIIGASGSLRVSPAGGGASASSDASGNFVLLSVPAGVSSLLFSGSGLNATLAIAPLVSGESRSITVSIANGAVTELIERSSTTFSGPIEAMDADGVAVEGRVVHVTSATAITVDGAAAALADLQLAMDATIEGALLSDGSVEARTLGAWTGGEDGDGGECDEPGDGGFGDHDGGGWGNHRGGGEGDHGGGWHDPSAPVPPPFGAFDGGFPPMPWDGGEDPWQPWDGGGWDGGDGHHHHDWDGGAGRCHHRGHGGHPSDAGSPDAGTAPEPGDLVFTGTLSAISGSTATVAGIAVDITASTAITSGGAPADESALQAGERVRVDGTLQSDHSVEARSIDVLQPSQPPIIQVFGPIASISGSSFTIGQTQLTTNASTRFPDAAGISALSVNENVQVEAQLQSDGTLLALVVQTPQRR